MCILFNIFAMIIVKCKVHFVVYLSSTHNFLVLLNIKLLGKDYMNVVVTLFSRFYILPKSVNFNFWFHTVVYFRIFNMDGCFELTELVFDLRQIFLTQSTYLFAN